MTLLIVYLAMAIGVSFLCSVLEAVLLSLTPSFVETELADNPKKAQKLRQVKENLDESLSSILILNTFAHTIGAAGVGSQALQVFGKQWETLIAILLTLAILYFSEIIPKTIGAIFWRQLARPAAFMILWLVRLVYPLVWLSSRLTRLFSHKQGNEITREEIIALASLSHKEGSLGQHENEYLSNLLKLRDIKTETILTPRTVVHMLPQNMTVTQALDNPRTRQFSRIPIYANNTDEITGKVMRADLYDAERNGEGNRPIEHLAIEIFRVSEKLPVQKLLDLLIKQKAHICLVEDEFGQTSGVVSLEDAIETLLGREIIDETDMVADMQELAKQQYRSRRHETTKDDNSSPKNDA